MNFMLRCGEECSEISTPTRLTTCATPSPSIIERAKCFGTTLSTPRPKRSSSGKRNTFKESAVSARKLTPRSTGRSASTGRASLTASKPVSNSKQATMKKVPSPFQQGTAEPLCPANIVATRRVIFSPESNPKKPPRTVKIPAHEKTAAPLLLPFRSSPTSDKENSGHGKIRTRFTDISSVQLTEVTKSYSFSDLSPKDGVAPVDDTTRRQSTNSFDRRVTTRKKGSEVHSQRFQLNASNSIDAQEEPSIQPNKPSLFERRAQWLQQRVMKANSFTEPEEAEIEPIKSSVPERRAQWLPPRAVKTTGSAEAELDVETKTSTRSCKETPKNMVAARSMWLQKQVSLHGMPGKEKSTEKRECNVRRKNVGLPDAPTVAVLSKSISPPRRSTTYVEVEGKRTNKLLKKAKKTAKPKKTLVEERAHWLQKQVCRNELHQDIPSDNDEQQEAGQSGGGEQPKSDIELRLEALKREMAANHHRSLSLGVAPKRALTELP